MKSRFIPLSILLILGAASLVAQPVQERVDVNMVLVDVTVTDARGNQILGLRADDFIVREDGEEQTIESIDYFTNRRLLTGPEEKAAFDVERVREERYFVLFFDEADLRGDSIAQGRLMRAQRDALRFVSERMKPQDLVAVAGFDARLVVYADFTSDRKVLQSAIKEVTKFSNGITKVPPYAGAASILRNIDADRMMNDTGRIYDALELLGDALRPIQARKVLALVSPGIGEASTFNARIPENEEFLYQPMIRALNAANVTVHSIALLEGTSFSAREQTLARVASDTGGEYFSNVVSFTTPLSRMEKESSGYYLLAYRIRKPEGDHGYQKIDVDVRNPEFRVRAREGYVY
jgi:VWFA-related protein